MQGTLTSETRRRRYLPVACEAPDGTVQPVEPQAGTRRAPPLRVAFGNRGFGSQDPQGALLPYECVPLLLPLHAC